MFWFRKRNKEKDISKNPFYDEGESLVIYFKCNNCGETFRSYLRKGYDFSNAFEGRARYEINKEYIGSKCSERIYLHAEFDGVYRLINFELVGGTPITRDEFDKN
ncbi:hypothetical protein XO10_06220 [Marinitoga sp. 1135]|uniref:Uncharacterized protein n=1 Tax=Marinitoga piezophila (strain DSM 14283 / JCM 11233 / KA3) TaxID=443254 RepID=H2J2X9_MARPK|nr:MULTISPECIES: hypothetical protein [Marinitoga]AEX85670.1 hypothetical protein Marpi_1266 [Marinitoga piezophila KA3]NUU95871.1 hypothetical protein [Marinitoga sp. 1135]